MICLFTYIKEKWSEKNLPFSLEFDLSNVIYNDDGFVKGGFVL
jgi:hypothetical protein